MTDSYLEELNEAQRLAVTNTDGPSLVIAGAGSGKTRVLTYRIVHLLHKKVPAWRILALTFTNKAAGEMRDRISALVDPQVARFIWMGTFHSIFARILRAEGSRLGYKQNFTIYDTSDSKSLIRSIIKEMALDDSVYKPGVIASRISTAKNNLVTANMYASDSGLQQSDKASRMPLMHEIYRTYAARCFRANAMDFDDLLLNTNILFRDFPDVLANYQEKFHYILVDEYQDTNYSQYLIVKKLAASRRNLCPEHLLFQGGKDRKHPGIQERLPRVQAVQARAELQVDPDHSKRGQHHYREQRRTDPQKRLLEKRNR